MRLHNVRPDPHQWIEEVVNINAADLLHYLTRRVNEPEDAADLLGRVFVALWENGNRIPTATEDARMWCFGIARNLLREHYRRGVRQIKLADGLREHLRRTTQDNAADTAAEANIRSAQIGAALAALDEHARELITLIHWDGFSTAEAARILSINQSTARTQYGRALKRLEGMLDDESSLPLRETRNSSRVTTGINY